MSPGNLVDLTKLGKDALVFPPRRVLLLTFEIFFFGCAAIYVVNYRGKYINPTAENQGYMKKAPQAIKLGTGRTYR